MCSLKKKLALRFELRTNRFAICYATTVPYELAGSLMRICVNVKVAP